MEQQLKDFESDELSRYELEIGKIRRRHTQEQKDYLEKNNIDMIRERLEQESEDRIADLESENKQLLQE